MPENHSQEGGSWSSGTKTTREENLSFDSFDNRLKELAERLKTHVAPERVQAVLPTEGVRRAFGSIKADTFSMYGIAVLEKQAYVLEIKEKKLLDQEIMKNLPTIYVGAGVDVEYPLTLGARNIIMVDPELKTATCLERLRQKIRNLADGKFTENDGNFYFEFDFGSGREKVNVGTDSRFYAEKGDTSVKEINRFTPPEKIGLLLSFQSADPTADKEALDNLATGGYILANRTLHRFTEGVFARSEWSERFGNASPAEKCSIIDSLYSEKGFMPIRLESFEKDYNQTFLRKL